MENEDILYAIKLLKSKEWDLQELDNAIDILLESWSSYNQIFNLLLLDGTISDDELTNYYIRKAKEQNPDYNKYLDYILGENK